MLTRFALSKNNSNSNDGTSMIHLKTLSTHSEICSKPLEYIIIFTTIQNVNAITIKSWIKYIVQIKTEQTMIEKSIQLTKAP